MKKKKKTEKKFVDLSPQAAQTHSGTKCPFASDISSQENSKVSKKKKFNRILQLLSIVMLMQRSFRYPLVFLIDINLSK